MQISERPAGPVAAVLSLHKAGLPLAVARALAARGVMEAQEATPGYAQLLPYSLLTGAVEMARVLADAIQAGKRLRIVADYDADGATACSVGLRALRAFGADVDFIIPDRVVHGYGLSEEVARLACTTLPRPDYLVTVDNGVASHAGIAMANSLGVPVLVTDHHLPTDTRPAALVIVNPNQHGCSFPSKALAGCGVIFYVMWALKDELDARGFAARDAAFKVGSLLPIVAVGTVADVVPLDLNNRALVNLGINLIRQGRGFAGIDELVKVSGKKIAELSTTDIAFGIGPRINAAGRLESMDTGVLALTTDDVDEARALAQRLHDINTARKEIESEMTDEAVTALLLDVKESRFTAVLHSDNWHHGVIGIVASRLKEKVWRPTFILASGPGGELKGSGRSIPGFHLRDALDLVDKRNPGLLLKFGGHAMAAGVTVRPGGLNAFSQAFEAVGREMLRLEDLNQVLLSDGHLASSDITLDAVAALKRQVWGQGFPEPVFHDTFNVISARPIGSERNHLKLQLEKDGRRFDAVKFRFTDAPPSGQTTLAYKLDLNTFRGETTVQMMVEYIVPRAEG